MNYPIPDGLTIQKVLAGDGETYDIPMPTYVSFGTQVDSKGRIWDLTLREQFKLDELIPGTTPKLVIDFHIFDNEGILLGIIPVDRSFEIFKIAGDRLYMVDSQNSMSIYEYKIVEK